MVKKINTPEKERALVLQGGGSLGAYGVERIGDYMNSCPKRMQTKGRKESLHLILLQALR